MVHHTRLIRGVIGLSTSHDPDTTAVAVIVENVGLDFFYHGASTSADTHGLRTSSQIFLEDELYERISSVSNGGI